jgi:hypothetical protein
MWPFKSSTKPRWQPVTQSESDTESQSGEKQPLGPTDYSDDSSSTAGLEYQSHGNPTPRRWTTAYLASMLILSLLVNVGTYIRDRRFDLGQACTEMTNINCMFPARFKHARRLTTSRVPDHRRAQDDVLDNDVQRVALRSRRLPQGAFSRGGRVLGRPRSPPCVTSPSQFSPKTPANHVQSAPQ